MTWNRRRQKTRERWITATILVAAGLGSWWVFLRSGASGRLDTSLELGARQTAEPVAGNEPPQANPQPAPASNNPTPPAEQPKDAGAKPESTNPPTAAPNTTNTPTETKPPPPVEKKTATTDSVESLLASAREAMEKNDPLAARRQLNQAWQLKPTGTQRAAVREQLEKAAKETLLSPRIIPGDELIDRYVVQTGDHLEKIASSHKVTIELLTRLNNLPNPNMIRIGQTLKVIKGPFRAEVDKASYTMDVYLGDTFVRAFKVGLGADDSTPSGEWQVFNKLRNPTYYPPRGGAILAADDPKNPLGEFWIGLQGTAGEAVGQQRYGIHGTIEPETIGQSASMGCIRLLNDEVEALFSYLVERHSTVKVVDGTSQASAAKPSGTTGTP